MKRFLLSLIFLLIIQFKNVRAQSGQYYYQKADSLYSVGNYLQAKEQCTKSLNFYRKSEIECSKIYILRSECLRALREYTAAISDVDSAIINNNKDGFAYYQRGRIYSEMQNTKLAMADYTTAINITHDNNERLSFLHDQRALEERKMSDFKSAITDDSIAIKTNPKNGKAYWNIGLSYFKTGKYESAIINYTAAITYQDNKASWSLLYYNRGLCYHKLKDYLKAIADYNYAITLNPADSTYYYRRGLSLASNGDYQLAINDYTTALAIIKTDREFIAEVYYNRGLNESNLHQPEKAIADFNTAISIEPKNGNFYWDRGNEFSSTGNFLASNKDYVSAIGFFERKKSLSSLNNNLADNYYFLKDYKKVIEYAKRALTLDSNNVSSYYYKGKALSKLGRQNEAISNFEKVLQLDASKKSSRYIFSLYYTKNYDKAFEIMNERIAKKTNQSDELSDYYNMACLLSLMNKVNEANTYLKLAVDGGYSKSYVLKDDDLDNISKSAAFIKLVKQ